MRLRRQTTRLTLAVLLFAGAVACSSGPSRSGLVEKLQQRNGLTPAQAKCVADGLYDGMPHENPPLKALTSSELRAVAKPDNAGKVPTEVVTTLRAVVTACVPTDAKPINPNG